MKRSTKKSGKKSSNYDLKKGKNTKSTTVNEPPTAVHFASNLDKDTTQTKSSTFTQCEATASSQIQPAVIEQSKKFSQRKIQSNWEKYEIPDDSNQFLESATTRGYDFKLLQKTRDGIGSHFQFKEEKDWTEEANWDSDSVNEILSLDINTMALSLSCIPFHQRLSMDPSYFTPKHIIQFEEVARLQRIKYEQDSFSVQKKDRKIDTVKPTQLLPSSVNNSVRFPLDNDIPIYHKDNTDSNIPTSKALASPLDSLKIIPRKETTVDGELEDELDAFLALNSDKIQNMLSIDISSPTLVLENGHITSIPIVEPSRPVPEIAAIVKGSFDDWLDSALED